MALVAAFSIGACAAAEAGSDVPEPAGAEGPACRDESDSPDQPDLDAVAPVSVPVVLSEYLVEVQVAVRDRVGDDVFGGAVVSDGDNSAMTITIHGTDLGALDEAVGCIAPGSRDRITVVESRYSVSDLDRFRSEAGRRLDAAGIDAIVVVRWGLDAVDVNLVTPDGEPDAEVERVAEEILSGLPTVITFTGPRVPTGPAGEG